MLYGIDIFSGAGGLSLGAEMAGASIMFAVEKDKNAAETYRYNHKNTPIICGDIHNVNPLQHITHIGANDQLIVFGGPPCQGFSTSNTVTRNMQNPNNNLFEEFVRFVATLNPDWFLFENVEGFYRFEKGMMRSKVKSCFEELGYTVSDKIVVASDYGVPQRRNRFIMIGNRHGIQYEFPEKQKKVYTVKDALSDLPDLSNGQMEDSLPYKCSAKETSEYAQIMRQGSRKSKQNYVSKNADYVIERYKYIGQGENWKAIPEDLMQNYANKANCHSGIYKRLKIEEPSIVISNYRKNMLIHPYQDRGLSVREAARLQSFPDSFIFKGSLTHIQQQIGNAVPPLLAKAVFEKILEYGE
ncbi:MAG: DNA cytosine methyltransferase [Bacteroidales bacterium]|nr:DNA cytosine methyltransferase [Bacteroidales bacterium]